MVRDDTIDVATFLGNVATETGRLEDVATRLDALLGDIAGAEGPIAMASLAQLQDMDHLRQALGALRILSRNGAEQLRAGQTAALRKDTLGRGVTLEAVRLACLDGPDRPGRDRATGVGGAMQAPDFF